MKQIRINTLVLILVSSLILCSCSELGDDEGGNVLLDGESILLPAEEGETVEVVMTMDADWDILNRNSWVAISPLKGSAGENTLRFRITEPNDSLREKVAYFDMTAGDKDIRYWLVQKGSPGVELIAEEYVMDDAAGGSLRIEVFANAEFEALCEEQWMTVEGISYGQDSTLLEDGTTYSELQTAVIDLKFAENPDNTQREAQLTLDCAGITQVISVVQFAELTADADWDREFYKTTLGLKFTGQSCQNCPMMAENFHKAQEQRPDRFEILNMHGYQKTDELCYSNAEVFRNYYGVSGFPHGIFNSMADLENEVGLVDKVVRLIDEALAEPAKTAISMNSVLDGTSLSLDGFIAVREDLDYKIHIFVMENDIIARQSGGSSDYEHDAVLRYAVTDDLGDALPGTGSNTVIEYANSVQLPSDVFYNGISDNAYLLIFTTYAHTGVPDGSVQGIQYSDYGMIVDNVAVLPLNGQAAFRYED